MYTTTPARGRNGPPNRKLHPGQTLVEFALTLPLLLLLLFGIVEFGRIFQAWVTLQNAARAAARVAITGNYDLSLFPTDPAPSTLDNAWTPTTMDHSAASPDQPYRYDGVPCDFTSPAAPYSFFRNHWGIDCNPTKDDHQFMRKDVLRLISINKAAQVGAAGLALGTNPRTHDIWMDIPGTESVLDSGTDPVTGPNAGIGAQHYADGLSKNDPDYPLYKNYASEPQTSLLYLSENQRAWFHVFVCSTRSSIRDEVDGTGASVQRYKFDPDLKAKIGGVEHQGFARCMVNEGNTNFTGLDHKIETTDVKSMTFAPDVFGQDQYDAGAPGDYVDIIVYFNHPLITPLGLGNHTFIQMQARRRAVVESFRSAKVINLGGNQDGGIPTDTPTFTPTFTQTPSETKTPTNTFTPSPTKTSTASHTPTDTPTSSPTATQSPTPSVTFTRPPTGDITRLFWNNVYKTDGTTPCNTVPCLTNNPTVPFSNSAPNFGNPNFCQYVPRAQTPWNSGQKNYGEILVGYLVPPATGSYIFYLWSSAASELDLNTVDDVTTTNWRFGPIAGTDSVGPSGAPTFSHNSPAVVLQANQRYYFIAYHKYSSPANNSNLRDNFAVGWKGPGATLANPQIIDGQYLERITPSNCTPPTVTPTPSITPTPSNTASPTITQTATKTYTPSITPPPSKTLTPTITPPPSNTPTNTLTPTKTLTPTITNTSLPVTPTNTFTPTKTPTKTYTPSPTRTPTNTPTNTPTPSNTPRPTVCDSETGICS